MVERGSLTETEGDPSADAGAVGGSSGSDGDGGVRRRGRGQRRCRYFRLAVDEEKKGG